MIKHGVHFTAIILFKHNERPIRTKASPLQNGGVWGIGLLYIIKIQIATIANLISAATYCIFCIFNNKVSILY